MQVAGGKRHEDRIKPWSPTSGFFNVQERPGGDRKGEGSGRVNSDIKVALKTNIRVRIRTELKIDIKAAK